MKQETKAQRLRENIQKNAREILDKEDLTGRDVARLRIMFEADHFLQGLSSPLDITPLFSEEVLAQLEESVAAYPEEVEAYNKTYRLYLWINDTQKQREIQLNQVGRAFHKLIHFLKTSIAAYDTARFRAKLPVIMTPEQYKHAQEAMKRKYLYVAGDTDKPRKESLYEFVLRALKFYRDGNHNTETENAKRWEGQLKSLLQDYNRQPVKSPYILKNYNKALNMGYYTLPDGRRSDNYTNEEWEKIAEPGLYKERHFRSVLSTRPSPEAEKLILENLRLRNKILLEGGSEKAAEKAAREKAIEAGFFLPTTFHLYENPPDYLDKNQILYEAPFFDRLYPALNPFAEYNTAYDPETGRFFPPLKTAAASYTEEELKEETQRQLEDFFNEFKEAIEKVCEDIDARYYNLIQAPDGVQLPLIPSVSAIPLEEWTRCFVTWPDLYNSNAYGMKETTDKVAPILFSSASAFKNGVAIIEEPGPGPVIMPDMSLSYYGFDTALFNFVVIPDEKDKEKGRTFYKMPEIEVSFPHDTLAGFLPEDPAYKYNREDVAESLKYACVGLSYAETFNAMLDLLIKVYGLPELEAFKKEDHLEHARGQADYYNQLIASLYFTLKSGSYENPLYIPGRNSYTFFTMKEDMQQHFTLRGVEPETPREKEQQERELKALLENFKPLNIEDFQPGKDELLKLKRELKARPEGLEDTALLNDPILNQMKKYF